MIESDRSLPLHDISCSSVLHGSRLARPEGWGRKELGEGIERRSTAPPWCGEYVTKDARGGRE